MIPPVSPSCVFAFVCSRPAGSGDPGVPGASVGKGPLLCGTASRRQHPHRWGRVGVILSARLMMSAFT